MPRLSYQHPNRERGGKRILETVAVPLPLLAVGLT